MASSAIDHWVTSPYCFCKDLPWLVLSGLPASRAVVSAGWAWQDWAILAAALIALTVFLFLLFLLLCLLCPSACPCCQKASACSSCCSHKTGQAGAMKEKKKGLGSTQALEMSSIGGSDASNLTAVDLKLPRAWMDASKCDFADGGDLGLGGASYGNQKTWFPAHGEASGGFGSRTTETEVHRRNVPNNTRGGLDEESVDGAEYYSARDGYYRSQSAVTIMSPNIGEHIREAVHEWQRKNGMYSKKLEESRQTRQEYLEESKTPRAGHTKAEQESNSDYSTVQSSFRQESSRKQEAAANSSSMALVKCSASGSGNEMVATGGNVGNGVPFVQCYTVTKKTTTTTYGDEEGDEETAVVTTTEKKWMEGMNEVGEISVAASASAGELLPSIGAPAHVLNDVSNARTVKSLTNMEGSASNVVRRYEFEQQTANNIETVL